LGVTSTDALTFNTTGSERMRLDSSGNLGIGTSSPQTSLDVRRASGIGIQFLETSSGNTTRVQLGTASGIGYINADAGVGTIALGLRVGGAQLALLDSSGNLGLGVTPSAQGVYRTMQFGNFTTIGQQTTGTSQSFFGWNVRGSSTANQYLYNVTADKAALYEIYSDASHRWSVTNTSGTAGNTISWTEAMTLDASGVLSVGTALAENSTGVYALPTGELRVKDSTENGTSQISIYNTNISSDLEQFFVAMNLDDVDLGNRRTDGGDLKLFTLNTERARISSDGTFRVAGAGTAGSTDALQISGSAPASSMVLNSSGVLTLGSALPVASGGTGATTSTGSGSVVLATNPTIARTTVTGNAQTTPVAVTFSATAMTVDCTLSNVFSTTFTANVTTAPTISNPQNGQTINWFITQDATGNRTMTWPSSFRWPTGATRTLSTAANSVDLLVATYMSSTGFWYASLSKGFTA
jgi:hypothetical protein